MFVYVGVGGFFFCSDDFSFFLLVLLPLEREKRVHFSVKNNDNIKKNISIFTVQPPTTLSRALFLLITTSKENDANENKSVDDLEFNHGARSCFFYRRHHHIVDAFDDDKEEEEFSLRDFSEEEEKNNKNGKL